MGGGGQGAPEHFASFAAGGLRPRDAAIGRPQGDRAGGVDDGVNGNVILRCSPSSASLEGWCSARCLRPSFEARKKERSPQDDADFGVGLEQQKPPVFTGGLL